jgi:hypothetical protein
MWLFTRYGFYSIACARKPDGSIDGETVMVRARRMSHLKSLQARFPGLAGLEILTWPDRDYRYRLMVAKPEWAGMISELAQEQDWSNFKNEAARHQGDAGAEYIHALHRVWSIMASFQESERLAP